MPLLYGLAFLTRATENILGLVAALGLCGGGQKYGTQGEES